jgi:TfoX/Sxy family transcriptional regulator of competence genes
MPDVSERTMFGGLAFLVSGHMACGIVGEELMLRLGNDAADSALDMPHVRPMDFTGRPMRSMVFVDPAGIATPHELSDFVDRAVRHAQTSRPNSAGEHALTHEWPLVFNVYVK